MVGSTLALARAGSEDAFADLVAPFRRELQLHCYRLSGSLTEAEDLLQETLLAAWRGLEGYAEQASIRTWLYRIATRRCLNARRDRTRRPVTEPLAPFEVPAPSRSSEVTWLQPLPEQPETSVVAREEIELAFLEVLQRLPPRQAAALVLCDVLGFSTAEAAAVLETSATAVKGALQRARAGVAAPDVSHRRHRPADASVESAVAQRFAAAFAADDIDAVVALLTDDAWLAMPPAPHLYVGSEAVAEFLRASAAARSGRHFRLVATRANSQPAFGFYHSAVGEDAARFAGVLVLTVRDDRVAGIDRFHDVDLAAPFGLLRLL